MEVVAALFIFFTAVLILQNRKLVRELESMDSRVVELEARIDSLKEETDVQPLRLDVLTKYTI